MPYEASALQACSKQASGNNNTAVLMCRFRQEEEDASPSYQREPKWKRIPPLFETIELLRTKEYLPAIWFIFSRAQCDKAARAVYVSGGRLTNPEEQAAILAMVTALRCFSLYAMPTYTAWTLCLRVVLE